MEKDICEDQQFKYFIIGNHIFFAFVKGLNTYEPSLSYIQEQFEKMDTREKINGHQRELYTHITCATDTEAMQFVFDAISDMIIQTNLIHAGIF
ncbi:unnamed protein product [Adineta steineri]|uniref:Uncharacterized protein n=1 Tax=Adineta steineri TaxID=433720 RepID=A0A814ACR5_9BILA|nr:unnamed protein product [Adineta steineri]